MKRILVCFFIGLFILSGCQSAADTNQKGSIETKNAFSPDNALIETSTLPGALPSIIDTPTYTQNPAITNDSTNENNQTPGVQANDEARTSTALILSTNNSTLPTQQDTIIPPTSTPSGRYIVITSAFDRKIGRAGIVFEPHGNFESGFYLVWSETNTMPVYTIENSQYVNPSTNGFNQSTVFHGTPGKTYHFRVCEFIDHDCGIYSNSYTFMLNNATATPTNTLTNNLIQIGISSAGEGTARVTWYTQKDYPNGFEIIGSSVVTMPNYPYNDSVHANNSDRSIIVHGEPGIRYYYRICGYIGNVCDDYSASVEYIYNYMAPTFTPTSTIVRWTPTEALQPELTATEIPPTNTAIPTQTFTEIPVIEEIPETPVETVVE